MVGRRKVQICFNPGVERTPSSPSLKKSSVDLTRVHFEPNVEVMEDWARRTGKPLGKYATVDLNIRYLRTRDWFLLLKTKLVEEHGFEEEDINAQLLFSIKKGSIHVEVSRELWTFFSKERQGHWQNIFHGEAYNKALYSIKPFHDLFNLLQCVLPGVFLFITEEVLPGPEKCGIRVITRGLPPLVWMQEHTDMLYDIFVANSYEKLLESAEDESSSYYVQYDSTEY